MGIGTTLCDVDECCVLGVGADDVAVGVVALAVATVALVDCGYGVTVASWDTLIESGEVFVATSLS